MAFLGGCSGATAALGGADDAKSDYEPETSEAAVSSGEAGPARAPKRPRASACHQDAGADKPKACDTLLASTFGDGGTWPSGTETYPQDVKDCCLEDIKASLANVDENQLPKRSVYHWECCAATNWGADANDQAVSMACTPWGPPVPPSMKRVRGGARIRRILAAAVA